VNFYPVHHMGFLSCARRTASSPSWRHSSRARVAAARPIICPVAVWTTILPILQMIVAQLVGLMLLFRFHKLTELLGHRSKAIPRAPLVLSPTGATLALGAGTPAVVVR